MSKPCSCTIQCDLHLAAEELLTACLAVRDRDVEDPDSYDKAHRLILEALAKAGR